MNNSCFDSLREGRLQWLPELGIGYHPASGQPYGPAYFEHYRELDNTPCGAALTASRIALVASYWQGGVVDIGVGGGRFVAQRPDTRGFDVNPAAIAWLKSQGAWCDPRGQAVAAATFWDSLEHIRDPSVLLSNIRSWVFVSCPIYDGPEHLMRSKHFKPGEHCWYWSHHGLQRFMRPFGFELVYVDRREEAHGREDIGSYVFKRLNS